MGGGPPGATWGGRCIIGSGPIADCGGGAEANASIFSGDHKVAQEVDSPLLDIVNRCLNGGLAKHLDHQLQLHRRLWDHVRSIAVVESLSNQLVGKIAIRVNPG